MDLFAAENIRVFVDAVDGGGAEFPEGCQAFCRRHADGFQSNHHLAHGKLLFEFRADFMRLFPGNALDCGKPLRLVFEDVKGPIAEGLDDLFRRGGTDALDRAGREIFQKLPRCRGEAALAQLRAELAAKRCMHVPVPHQAQLFPGRQSREDTHHRYQFPVAVQVQHGKAGIRAVERDVLHTAAQFNLFLFVHSHDHLSSS